MLRLITAASVIAGGLCLALTLPRPGVCWLGWFALVPLLYTILRNPDSARPVCEKYGASFLFGLSFYGLTFYWIYATCRFAGLSAAIAMSAWFLLCAVLSLNWIVFALAAARLIGDTHHVNPAFGSLKLIWWVSPILATAWAGIEFLGSRFTPGIGLVSLAYTQWGYPSWIQGISLAGPQVLSFIIVLWNSALACAILSFRRGAGIREAAKPLMPACLVMAAWWSYGTWVVGNAPVPGQGAQARIAILQPNIDQYVKWDEGHSSQVRAVLDGLIVQAETFHPDLILWPETAVPGWFDEAQDWVHRRVAGTKSLHIVGALTREQEGRYNAALLMSPSGKESGVYHKQRLVPFGEFVPVRFLERYVGLLAQMGDLTPGSRQQSLFKTPWGKLGTTICYEALFAHFHGRAARQGARAIVNITNDGWYKNTWGPYLHFYANLFRAIENRVYVLRAGNTGISAVIDPYGRVLASQALETRGVLLAAMPALDPFPGRSPYARWGDWFGWLCVLTSLTLSFLLRGRKS